MLDFKSIKSFIADGADIAKVSINGTTVWSKVPDKIGAIYGNSALKQSSNVVSCGDPTTNLFNKNDFLYLEKLYLNMSSMRLEAYATGEPNDYRTIYFPCKSETEYTVSLSKETYMRVGLASTTPQKYTRMLSIYNRGRSSDSITFTTTPSTKYIVVQLYGDDDYNAGTTTDECVSMLQIEYGDTATEYSDYYDGYRIITYVTDEYGDTVEYKTYSPIQLCKAGYVYDTISIDGTVTSWIDQSKFVKGIDPFYQTDAIRETPITIGCDPINIDVPFRASVEFESEVIPSGYEIKEIS